MTARAEWIPSRLSLKAGYVFCLNRDAIEILKDPIKYDGAAIRLEPKTSAEAAELSIALKRAQRRMDQIFREMRAAEEAR